MSNKNQPRDRVVNIVVGRPRSGKTYWTEKVTDNKYDLLVYNWGRPTDWQKLTAADHITTRGKRGWQSRTDKIIVDGTQRDLITDNDNRIKTRCFGNWHETKLFIGEYIAAARDIGYESQVVIDDASALYSDGKIDGAMNTLISSASHYMCDVYLIFHNVNDVPKKCFNYADNLILFAEGMSIEPSLKRVPYFKKIKAAQQVLLKQPKYSFYIINLKGYPVKGNRNWMNVINK